MIFALTKVDILNFRCTSRAFREKMAGYAPALLLIPNEFGRVFKFGVQTLETLETSE